MSGTIVPRCGNVLSHSRSRQPGEVPVLGSHVPVRGTGWTKGLGRWVLKTWGWRITGEFPNRSKVVMILAPHTSNVDFFVSLAVIVGMGLRTSWMGKHTLFRPPFKWLMRSLGGIPIHRSANHGTVEQMVDAFRQREQLILGVTPEGTRSKVLKWKTGFHRIAVAAKVPILLVYIDYTTKQLGFGPLFEPSDSLEQDMRTIREFYQSFQGRNPENM